MHIRCKVSLLLILPFLLVLPRLSYSFHSRALVPANHRTVGARLNYFSGNFMNKDVILRQKSRCLANMDLFQPSNADCLDMHLDLCSSPPISIALLIEPTPFTHISGYSNRFKEMLKFLDKAGDNVSILTTDHCPDKPSSFLRFPISYTRGFRPQIYDRISLTFDTDLKGWSVIEKHKPDIIHVTSPGFIPFAALLYARIFKVPIVFSYHTHLPLYARTYIPAWVPMVEEIAFSIIRFVHNRADLTLVTSPQIKTELEKEGIERVDVWQKGIDTERFNPSYKCLAMRSELSDGHPSDPLLIYIGRLGEEKRLRLIGNVLEHLPNVRMAFVGDGPDADHLKTYFSTFGSRVIFTGSMVGERLSQAFASADVFIMPSDTETLGFVVLEAMASGVPVVAARAGGIPDLICHGKTGFLCPAGDAKSFAETIKTLMNDLKLREMISCAARIETEKHSWEAATSYLRNVQYKKAITNFKYRAFKGLGLPRTRSKWRFLLIQFRTIIKIFQRGFNKLWPNMKVALKDNYGDEPFIYVI